MIKRHIEETFETYDKDGTVLTRSVTVTDEEDDGNIGQPVRTESVVM